MRTSHDLLLIDIYLSSGFLHLSRRNSSHLSATYPLRILGDGSPLNTPVEDGSDLPIIGMQSRQEGRDNPLKDEGSERLARVW
jgi:hypothetical protein